VLCVPSARHLFGTASLASSALSASAELLVQAWKVMENSKGHGKSWKMMIMSWNFYYCTKQFCKSYTTSFIKSNYEPFYLFKTGLVLREDGTVTTNSGMHS